MEAFSALLAICAGNSPVTGEVPSQRPVTRSFDVFFYLRLIKRLSGQSRGWWFETPSRPLWRHCNVYCSNNDDMIACCSKCTGWHWDRLKLGSTKSCKHFEHSLMQYITDISCHFKPNNAQRHPIARPWWRDMDFCEFNVWIKVFSLWHWVQYLIFDCDVSKVYSTDAIKLKLHRCWLYWLPWILYCVFYTVPFIGNWWFGT